MKTKKREQRQYPREVWIVSPAYIVKQVTVTGQASPWSNIEYGDRDQRGKHYALDAIHETKQGAIDWGRNQIATREVYLEKQHALLDARRIKLDKAEAAA
jgi:hypothetical protein